VLSEEGPQWHHSMKTHCLRLFASSLGLLALCQCQLPLEKPNFPVIEQKVVKVGDKTFVERRLLVNKDPRETKMESIQVD